MRWMSVAGNLSKMITKGIRDVGRVCNNRVVITQGQYVIWTVPRVQKIIEQLPLFFRVDASVLNLFFKINAFRFF